MYFLCFVHSFLFCSKVAWDFLGLRPREIPWSSPTRPRKTPPIPPLLLGLTHSQLQNTKILKFISPVLLNLLGNIFTNCPAVRAIRKIDSSNIYLQEGQCWRMSVLLLKSGYTMKYSLSPQENLGLGPREIPWA